MSSLAAQRLSVPPSAGLDFGAGAVARLPEHVASLRHDRALVITDAGLGACGVVERVLAVLAGAGVAIGVFDAVSQNPSTDTLDGAAAAVREFGAGVLVALGGGSVLDAAKGIALLAENPELTGATAADAEPARDGRPVIAVPTTSGTGAETNGFGVFEDPASRRKVYIGHDSVRPRIAVLDPELTVGVPPAVTAATGVDALVHGIESLASRGASPLSDGYASQAVAMVGAWLPAAYRDGGDLEARARLMLGAHLAGRALSLSGLGLVHGIGHAVTAHTGTPHGVALAAVLPEVMEFSLPAAGIAYARVTSALGVAEPRAAIETVRGLCDTVGVRRGLRELGAGRAMLADLAAAALADPVTRNSPVLPTDADLRALLESVY